MARRSDLKEGRRELCKPKFLQDEATVQNVGRLMFNGHNNEEIAILTELPRKYIEDLRQGDSDPRARKHSLQLKDDAIELVKSGDKGSTQLYGMLWFLERRYPKQFARPEVQLSLTNGAVTNNTLVISADAAEGLLRRSKEAHKEIDALIKARHPAEALDTDSGLDEGKG